MTRGEIMRMHRERARLTQCELAKLSGISQVTISALEKGRNSGGNLETARLHCLAYNEDFRERRC